MVQSEQRKGDDAVAEEFIDFYEVLELPLESDRNTLRKRINEKYLESQRNLDHRTFATRVKYQELFEMTLPQARYILLDEARRTDYDRLVVSMRALKSGGPPQNAPAPVAPNPAGTAPGFRLKEEAGEAPTINPLPGNPVDEAAIARERDELWRKWKSGLEQALVREAETENNPKPAPSPTQTPAPRASASSTKAADSQPVVLTSLVDEEEEARERATIKEAEQRRANHKREILKDVLEGVGLKAMLIGAGAVIVPGVMAMLAFMTNYYPIGAAPKIAFPSGAAWALWLIVIALGAFFTARGLSKSMRRKAATELSALSYEELLKRSKRAL